METLASFWARDPCDLGQNQHNVSTLWDSHCTDNSPPPASSMVWPELSPHLQRNKQLHDTLLQREEELARLQEENNKLRQFLNSSFVKNLEEKAKKLFADGKRKRNLSSFNNPISKRVRRNLISEFCSQSETSEPSLDLWVLQTLGLKDKDTIDTTSDQTATNCNEFSYNPRIQCFPPITAHMLQADYSPVKSQASEESSFANSNVCTNLSEVYSSTSYSSPNVQASSEHRYLNGQSPNSFSTIEKSTLVEQKEATNWSSPLQATLSYSPSKRLHFSPLSCSTPNKIIQSNSNILGSPKTPQTRPDLAFSMSISPSSSVKTHSFPQGQAFVRRDTQGRCNFTWVPKESS